jgi:hypothetical protein
LQQESIDKLGLCLFRLSTINKPFYFESITHFKYNENYCEALGIVLATQNKESIDVFVNLSEITMYDHRIEAYSQMLRNIENNSTLAQIEYICKKIFDKWESYLNVIEANKIFINNIVRSDYYNFVLYHYKTSIKSKNDLLNLVNNIISTLINLNSIWCENLSHQFTLFFTNLTKLYFLSVVWKSNEYTFNHNENYFISLFLNDKRIWIKYFDKSNTPIQFQYINYNFGLSIPTILTK